MADPRFPDSSENDPNSGDDLDVIELIDDEGETVSFEHMATLEYEGETFLVLSPVNQDPAGDSDEEMQILIMQILQDEQGQDYYVRPEEATEEKVFEQFLSMIDEMDEEDSQ